MEAHKVGAITISPLPPWGYYLRHNSGEGMSVPVNKFEAEVCPLHELTQEHVEQVFRFYGRMF